MILYKNPKKEINKKDRPKRTLDIKIEEKP